MRHNFLKRFDCHEFFRRLNYKYWDSGNYRTSAGFAKYLSTMPTQLKQRSWQHRVPTIRTTIFNCTIFSFFFLFCLNGSANAQTPKANKGDGIDVTKPEFMDKYDVNDRIQIAWSTLTPAQQPCNNPATGNTPYMSCCRKVKLSLFKTTDGVSTVVDDNLGKEVGNIEKYGPSLVYVKDIVASQNNAVENAYGWNADTIEFDNYSIQVNCTVPGWSNYSGFSPLFQIYGAPSPSPSSLPTAIPTLIPSLSPSALPTLEPSPQPTDTRYPSPLPTAPTFYPTSVPSPAPTFAPYWTLNTWGKISFSVSNGQSTNFNNNQLLATKDAIKKYTEAVLTTSEIISASWEIEDSDTVAFRFTYYVEDLSTHGFNTTTSVNGYDAYRTLAENFAENEVTNFQSELSASWENFTWFWRRKARDYGESLSAMKNIEVQSGQSNSYLSLMSNRITVDYTKFIRPTAGPTPLPTANPTTVAPTNSMSPTLVPTWFPDDGPKIMRYKDSMIIGACFGALFLAFCALMCVHNARSRAWWRQRLDCSKWLQEEVPEWKDRHDEYPQENNIFALKRRVALDNVLPEPYWLSKQHEKNPLKTADPWYQAKDHYDRDPIEMERDDMSISTVGAMTRHIHRNDLSKGPKLSAFYHMKNAPLDGNHADVAL